MFSTVLLLGLGLLIDWTRLGEAAGALSWSVLSLSAAILLIQVLIGAWRANLFLRMAGTTPDSGYVVQAYALGVLANALLINFVAGAIARIVLLHRHRVSVSVSIAVIVAEKITILATLLGLAVVAAWIWVRSMDYQVPSMRDAMLLIGAGLVVIGVFAATARRWGRLVRSILRGWPRATVDHCLALLASRPIWLVGVGTTLLSLVCAWGAYTLLAQAMGIEGAGAMIALALPIVSVIASLPISIGGWGVREVSFSALLYGVGVPAEKSVLVTAIASLLGIAAALAVALAVFAGKRRVL